MLLNYKANYLMVESTFKKIDGVVDRYKGMEVVDLSSLEDTEEAFEK